MEQDKSRANSQTAFRLDRHTLVTMMFGGALATVAFDFYGQSISPMLGFSGLAPVPLANNVITVLFGEPYSPGAHFLHYMAGMDGCSSPTRFWPG